MKHTRRRFLAVCATAALTCSNYTTQKPQPITRQRFRALGTKAQITLVGKPQQAQLALMACREEVTAIESSFSLYNPGSMLSQLNQNGSVTATNRFSTLLRYALSMAETTSGAFDPTVQPLWHALATGGDLEQAYHHIDWRDLLLSKGEARFTRAGMAASFNGIAQGFAADRVTAILAQHGFHNTLVDLGEFAARGTKPGEPWRLGIYNPLTQQTDTTIEPAGAIATSEPHGTLIDGQSHIVDPLRRPGERWASVTVEAGEAWRADALSTAIAASPMSEAESLLATGGATRGWLISASDLLEWRA